MRDLILSLLLWQLPPQASLPPQAPPAWPAPPKIVPKKLPVAPVQTRTVQSHTHRCPSCGVEWGGPGHGHNCPRCGRSVTVIHRFTTYAVPIQQQRPAATFTTRPVALPKSINDCPT